MCRLQQGYKLRSEQATSIAYLKSDGILRTNEFSSDNKVHVRQMDRQRER